MSERMQVNGYLIFHANLAFSAIEFEQRPEVIDKAYFPLLELLEANPEIKIGLEISGYSLEWVARLRPDWIEKFKALHGKGQVELLGSGYMQIIGPLVPYVVNVQNQKIGLAVYQEILGLTPRVAYVNEQALSASLIDLYAEVGYSAIAMEWNNLYSANMDEWKKSYAFQSVYLKGLDASLPVIWTDTILFQQFQRTAHFEQGLDDYSLFLDNYVDEAHRWIALYSSDLEIFNYRPGRFETEARLEGDEWLRIEQICCWLMTRCQWVLPSETLRDLQPIYLSPFSAQYPILVKKQKKYSLSRWAACGRDANWINTLCHRRLVQLSPASSAADWKQLLVYWGSDYRTHTTLSKWNHALADLLKAIEEDDEPLEETPAKSNVKSDEVFSERQGQLIFRSSDVQAVFLLNKGMALDCLTVAGVKQAFGTVHHGQFSHISYVADFYTGSSVIEAAGIGKLADLTQLKSYQTQQVGEGTYQLTCQLMMKDVAVLVKTWTINLGLRQLSFEAKVSLKKMVFGSIRLGTFTLKTDDAQAWYETHNGGPVPERYPLRGQVSQHSAASLLQSSHSGLGTSEGVVRLGCSASQMLELKLDQTRSCPFCLLESYAENGKRLTRLYFSLQELDDTLKVNETKLARDFYVQWQVNY